jgi:L-threonylcarbamoyladenylate synthase
MTRRLEADDRGITEAADALRAGGLVAFPTETVYGLGADTFGCAALARVFALKGRPLDNPLIAHVSGPDQARRVVAEWTEAADALAERFWPGPLTVVLPRSADVPDEATAGLPTVAVRSPAHPAARALIERFDGPISAPSANRSGHVSPTSAAHVLEDFPACADLIVLDGGPCSVGIESTVLDLTGAAPSVLRSGGVSIDALREVLGDVAVTVTTGQGASPGTAQAHYAPHTVTEIVETGDIGARLARMDERAAVLCFEGEGITAPHVAIAMPDDDEAYARRLYGALRDADALGCERILIERPPHSGGLWDAVHDRLRRATAGG